VMVDPEPINKAANPSWKLEFDVRGTRATDFGSRAIANGLTETAQSTVVAAAMSAMEEVFGDTPNVEPKNGVAYLSERLGVSRRDWSPSLLREMWRYLIDHQAYRKISAEHESRWLNMVGWCLRPGFGMAADDWRVNRTWRSVHNKLLYRTALNATETIVLWRRIAGGFTPGQQRALFQDCWPRVKPSLIGGSQSQTSNANVLIELLRLVGSLEWLSIDEKCMIADQLLIALSRKKLEALHGTLLWTLGRLGSRSPIYASLQQVIRSTRVQTWVDKLLEFDTGWIEKNATAFSLCMMQISRRTDDRYRDVETAYRDRIVSKLQQVNAPSSHVELVQNGGGLDQANEESIVGDSLPLGFRLFGDAYE
jgi:hypothetical protein